MHKIHSLLHIYVYNPVILPYLAMFYAEINEYMQYYLSNIED